VTKYEQVSVGKMCGGNTAEERELIEAHVEAKGLDPELIRWDAAIEAAASFSNRVCGK
jgi:hypothetical protein